MSRIIKCQVNDEYLLGSGVVIGAAGSHGDVFLQLQFNEMWDGLSIIATFRDAMNENSTATMLMPTMLVDGEIRTYLVRVPDSAKRIAGRARLTLTGYSVYTIEDNGTVTPIVDSLTNTATAFFRVLESDSVILDDGSITNATFVQWVHAEITRAGKIIDEAEAAVKEAQEMLVDFDEAENGVFDSESNLITPGRVQNETARLKAEAARDSAELEREKAEEARKSAEEKRNKDMEAISLALSTIIAIQNELIGGDE